MAEELPPPLRNSDTPPEIPPSGNPVSKTSSKDKRPRPLLSRSKLKPPREIPVSPELTGKSTSSVRAQKFRKDAPLWVRIVSRILAYAAIVGLGYGAYQMFRQTQVQGAISVPGYELPTEILIVRDFSDDLRSLRQEFLTARQPYIDEIKTKQSALVQIQSDLAGLEERERLFQGEIDNSKSEIAAVISKGQEDALKVWDDNAKPMEDEYKAKLLEFENKIKDRATALGLEYQDDPSVQSPEVWVNGFRLALYSPPKGVKPADERAWAEDQLKQWNIYEKSQADKRQALKDQADAIHKAIAPKIKESDDQQKHLQARISETEDEAKPIRDEQVTVTGQLNDAKAMLQSENEKYYAQLFEIPTRNVLDKLPLEPEGRWQLKDLDQNSKYIPGGNYLMMFTIKKGGQDYWALVPFSPTQYQTLKILVAGGAFIRASSLLE